MAQRNKEEKTKATRRAAMVLVTKKWSSVLRAALQSTYHAALMGICLLLI